MKKIMFFAAVAAVVSLASCQKEALNEAAGTESPVFTATISTGTKTTVNATDGKVAWESTDKITITDASEASATYKIKSIDGNTGKATFEVESGTLGQGPYTATYGTAPTTAQTYSATPGNLYMTASETSTNSLTFIVQCGLMEINLTKAGASVKSIAVTGTPTGESETTYTLTCTDAQSIAEKTAFYISVAAGSYNKIVITDSEDKVCTLTAASGITVATNHIKPVTFEGSKLDFIPDGALLGVFTVSDSGTPGDTSDDVKVHFSKGNLYAIKENSTWSWHFYDEQYKYNSIAISSDTRTATANDTEIDLFTWGYNATNSVNPIGTEYVSGHDTEGNKQLNPSTGGDDWGVAYCGSNGIAAGTWRMLTTAEWLYLFDTRATTTNTGTDNARYAKATINGKVGIILLPDTYTHPSGVTALTNINTKDAEYNVNTYSVTEWEKLEAAGAVCLPAAGYRNGSYVSLVGSSGFYWSSTARLSVGAYSADFSSRRVGPDNTGDRDRGLSVRLITESN